MKKIHKRFTYHGKLCVKKNCHIQCGACLKKVECHWMKLYNLQKTVSILKLILRLNKSSFQTKAPTVSQNPPALTSSSNMCGLLLSLIGFILFQMEEVNHIDRYYYEQKLRDFSEEEKSPEWYSDYEYAVQLHFCEEDLSEMTHFLTSRNYDRENKKKFTSLKPNAG